MCGPYNNPTTRRSNCSFMDGLKGPVQSWAAQHPLPCKKHKCLSWTSPKFYKHFLNHFQTPEETLKPKQFTEAFFLSENLVIHIVEILLLYYSRAVIQSSSQWSIVDGLEAVGEGYIKYNFDRTLGFTSKIATAVSHIVISESHQSLVILFFKTKIELFYFSTHTTCGKVEFALGWCSRSSFDNDIVCST